MTGKVLILQSWSKKMENCILCRDVVARAVSNNVEKFSLR